MKIFEITRAWAATHGTLHPGRYRVPDQLSKIEARCAIADGAGKFVSGQEDDDTGATFPGGKRSAPDNKSRGAAPDNKSEVGKLSAGDSGGAGAKPGKPAAGALTTGSIVRGAGSRGK